MGTRVGIVGVGSAVLPQRCRCCAAVSMCMCTSRPRCSARSGPGAGQPEHVTRAARAGAVWKLAQTGVKPLAFHQRRWDDGRTLLRSPLGERLEAAFGFPHYQMRRADLLTALAAAVPAERVHLRHRLTGLTDHGNRSRPARLGFEPSTPKATRSGTASLPIAETVRA